MSKGFNVGTIMVLYQNLLANWFARFCYVKDEPPSGHKNTDKYISTIDIGIELLMDYKTMMTPLHKADYKKKLDAYWFLMSGALKTRQNVMNQSHA